jgi:hypothetical protein
LLKISNHPSTTRKLEFQRNFKALINLEQTFATEPQSH